VWFSGSIVGALLGQQTALLGLVGAATGLLLPWMHHALKRYQHSHISYGNVGARFRPAIGRFYFVYLKGLLLLFMGAAGGSFAAIGIGWLIDAVRRGLGLDSHGSTGIIAMVAAGTVGLIAYLGVWPYFAARLQQLVWGNTQLGPVGFETKIRAWPLLLLVGKSVALTLVTLGLYWPYAAVALARYRIENMEVIAPEALSETAASVGAAPVAAGEGAADLFGLDVGL
jgi:uncharacterized membrane protein YjgN (DUF898 family)